MAEGSQLNVTLRWIGGRETRVRVNELSPAKVLLDLSYQKNVLNLYPFLIFNGKLIDLSLTLKSQNIVDGDTLVVYEHSESFYEKMESPECEANYIDDIMNFTMLNMLKINDIALKKIETYKKANELYESIVREQEEHDDQFVDDVKTNDPGKSTRFSSEPLPLFFSLKGRDNVEPQNVDTLNRENCIAKQPFNGWIW